MYLKLIWALLCWAKQYFGCVFGPFVVLAICDALKIGPKTTAKILKCAQFFFATLIFSTHTHTHSRSLIFSHIVCSILKFPPCVSPQIKLAAVRKRYYYYYLDLRHFKWATLGEKCVKRYWKGNNLHKEGKL